MRILYFAWLREQAGIAAEDVAVPDDVADVLGLIAWLRARGGGPARALADPDRVRVAVDQEFARFDAPIAGAEEVAFFPPVTGGRRPTAGDR